GRVRPRSDAQWWRACDSFPRPHRPRSSGLEPPGSGTGCDDGHMDDRPVTAPATAVQLTDVQVTVVDELSSAEQDAVRALAARATLADGVAPLSEQPLLSLGTGRPEVTHLLALGSPGAREHPDAAAVVGYAQVDL